MHTTGPTCMLHVFIAHNVACNVRYIMWYQHKKFGPVICICVSTIKWILVWLLYQVHLKKYFMRSSLAGWLRSSTLVQKVPSSIFGRAKTWVRIAALSITAFWLFRQEDKTYVHSLHFRCVDYLSTAAPRNALHLKFTSLQCSSQLRDRNMTTATHRNATAVDYECT